MKAFKNGLEVGQPAMIVGCKIEENRKYIGSIVMIEQFVSRNDLMNQYFEPYHKPIAAHGQCVRISGYKGCSKTFDGIKALPGVGFFSAKNLMPLPPIEDEQLSKETEKDMEAV